MAKAAPNLNQDEFPFDSVKSHAVFPGRTTLYVNEVAAKLGVSPQHIVNLCQSGEIKAINIASNIKGGETPKGRSAYQFLRIPTTEYDALIERRRNDK